MTRSENNPPVIEYAPAEGHGEIPFLRQMMWWRSLFGACFWIMIVGLFLWSVLSLAAGVAAIVAAVFTIIYMGRAAWNDVDGSYAAQQVVLAIALTPMFFLGVWIVPALVKSDLIKWRAIEEEQRS